MVRSLQVLLTCPASACSLYYVCGQELRMQSTQKGLPLMGLVSKALWLIILSQ